MKQFSETTPFTRHKVGISMLDKGLRKETELKVSPSSMVESSSNLCQKYRTLLAQIFVINILERAKCFE